MLANEYEQEKYARIYPLMVFCVFAPINDKKNSERPRHLRGWVRYTQGFGMVSYGLGYIHPCRAIAILRNESIISSASIRK